MSFTIHRVGSKISTLFLFVSNKHDKTRSATGDTMLISTKIFWYNDDASSLIREGYLLRIGYLVNGTAVFQRFIKFVVYASKTLNSLLVVQTWRNPLSNRIHDVNKYRDFFCNESVNYLITMMLLIIFVNGDAVFHHIQNVSFLVPMLYFLFLHLEHTRNFHFWGHKPSMVSCFLPKL